VKHVETSTCWDTDLRSGVDSRGRRRRCCSC
jgi:hypothetical protein